MIQIFYMFIAFCAADVHALFTYDSAARLMEQGKWNEAKVNLQKVLVDKPDEPDVLYDAGVASYKTKDYRQAQAYFNRVTHLPKTTVNLKEQAHFNAGNAAVALKEFEEGIKQFQEVLNINKNNIHAQHNIEQTKKLLEQQKEQKESQEQKENKDKQNKEDKKNKNSSDAQQQRDDNKNKEQNSQREQQENKNMSQDSQQQQEKRDEEQQKRDQAGESSDQKRQQEADKSKQEEEKHAKTSSENDAEQQAQSSEGQEKEQDEAFKAILDTINQAHKKMDERLVRVLEAQEKRDAALNKHMVNCAVGQSMGGTHGENCW